MRVLVVSEGSSELGTGPESSALATLASRLIQHDYLEFACRKVSDPVVHTHRPRGKHAQYERRALGWVRFAERESFDALVFVIDQDDVGERETGINNAQTHAMFSLPRAMGVAIKMFDAWMLADEVALSSAFGRNVLRQKQPESLKNPKLTMRDLHDDDDPATFSDLYSQIAAAVNLDRLSERCPKGFAPFRLRVESLSVEQ